MANTVPDILARIVRQKRQELAEVTTSLNDLERRARERQASRRDFRTALVAKPPAIIGEIKQASPSKGVLVSSFDPASSARTYERGGAAALSVLTDATYFQGSLDDLEAARAAVRLPVLRKDFTLTEYHVLEAAAHGADAILLIAAILSSEELTRLRELAAQYGIAALVEVHDERELESALSSGARIVGVNNRNLRTFETTLETSLALAAKMPAGVIKVSESGIRSAAEIRLLHDTGFQAFLIGEHLMKSDDPAAALEALLR
jgi:indole-3-glycerol phosphate synthase